MPQVLYIPGCRAVWCRGVMNGVIPSLSGYDTAGKEGAWRPGFSHPTGTESAAIL